MVDCDVCVCVYYSAMSNNNKEDLAPKQRNRSSSANEASKPILVQRRQTHSGGQKSTSYCSPSQGKRPLHRLNSSHALLTCDSCKHVTNKYFYHINIYRHTKCRKQNTPLSSVCCKFLFHMYSMYVIQRFYHFAIN